MIPPTIGLNVVRVQRRCTGTTKRTWTQESNDQHVAEPPATKVDVEVAVV